MKVNCVVMRGVNDDELGAFVNLTKDLPLDVRFIEWMPFDSNAWNDDRFLPYYDMLRILRAQGYPTATTTDDDDLLLEADDTPSPHTDVHAVLERLDAQAEIAASDTTKWYRARGHVGRVGFITSMSEHFCGTCNRLRITADGKLKACLFGSHEVDLRTALRNDEEDTVALLEGAVSNAMGGKAFALGGHKDMHAIAEGKNRPMIRIGG